MGKRFIGLFGALAIAIGLFGAFVADNWSYDALVAGHPYVAFTNSTDQIRDFDYQRANYDARVAQGDNPLLIFGSSELGPERGAFYPARFWTNNNYGMDLQTCGKPYVTDLWDAIMVGAFAKDGIQNNKVVLSPSMQWFLGATHYGDVYQRRFFSQNGFDAFMSNPKLSDSLKNEVLERVKAHHINEGQNPLDTLVKFIDYQAECFQSGVNLRYRTLTTESDASSVDYRDYGSHNQAIPEGRFGDAQTPDWPEIQQEALAATQEKSGNELGVSDKWYKKDYQGWLNYTAKWDRDAYDVLDSTEIEEFDLLLETCKEAGIEALVVISPVNGPAWDQTPYTKEYREQYYDMIREHCEKYGAKTADLSGYEDAKYYFRDDEHPSEYGWSIINEQIYNFYMGDASDNAGNSEAEE